MILSADNFKQTLRRLHLSSEVTVFDHEFLLAQDQELTVRVKGFNIGEFSVASKTLSQIASKLNGEVSLEFKEPTLVIKSGRSRFKLNTTPANCPKIADVSEKWTVPLPELKTAMSYATTATEDAMKYSYQGSVYLSGKTVVATDGFRLALFTSSVEFPKLLIPSRAAENLQHLEGDTVVVSEGETAISFQTDGVVLQTQKLAKTFCGYESVIPKSTPFNCTFQAEAMKQSLLRVAPMAGQTKVRMVFEDGTCVLTTTDVAGEAHDELGYDEDLDGLGEDPLKPVMEVVVNHSHVLDYVAKVSGTVKFGASDRQAIFENSNKLLILMTMRK